MTTLIFNPVTNVLLTHVDNVNFIRILGRIKYILRGFVFNDIFIIPIHICLQMMS